MIAKKSYIHTPKPQIQSVEPRKRRLGIRTIPCVLVNREESRKGMDPENPEESKVMALKS